MIEGSIVALVTPMTADGQVDWKSLHALVEWHIEKGTNSIVAVGTTGESATLTVSEHSEVIAKVVDQVNGRIPVIAGTGANSTAEAIELSRAAKDIGADACLSVTPYYNKPTQEGLFQHYSHIAKSVDIPQILYNVPGRTGVDMSVETVIRLSTVNNIIGVKEATGDIERAKEIIANCPSDFLTYSGDDITAVELILAGGHGNISVTANVLPDQMAKLCALALQKSADEARALNNQLMPLHEGLFVEPNPIPVKWAMAAMGKTEFGIRLPLTPLSENLQQPLRELLANAGAL